METILVVIIVAGAVACLCWHIAAAVRTKGPSCGCGGCHDCSTPSKTEPVEWGSNEEKR
jgi:hypothetical protein